MSANVRDADPISHIHESVEFTNHWLIRMGPMRIRVSANAPSDWAPLEYFCNVSAIAVDPRLAKAWAQIALDPPAHRA